MSEIVEASDLPEDEKVYLKKDFLGWRVVEPPTKWHHYLFGSKRNLVVLIILLIIFFLFYIGINELISNYKMIADDPCKFCSDCHEAVREVLRDINDLNYKPPKLNLSSVDL